MAENNFKGTVEALFHGMDGGFVGRSCLITLFDLIQHFT